MPRRIVIHAGFHKTGTSTIQDTLRENRVALKGHAALRLRWHMRPLLSATRGYSTWRDPLSLIKAEHRFEALLTELPQMPRRVLILSAEELAGHLPGRGDLDDYSATPILLRHFHAIAQRLFPKAGILFYLSTRAPEPWLRSAYWEHVKASNMTLDFDAFHARYHKAADLEAMVQQIEAVVPVPVHHKRLEECADLPLGPADPLLDLCDLPLDLRAQLRSVPPSNQHLGAEVLEEMLKVNRTHTTSEARKAAKALILAKAHTP